MKPKKLEIDWVAIGRLHFNPANPRRNEEAIPYVTASLTRFGWRQPIVAKLDGEVIAGNTRLKAAIQLGMNDVPVVWFEGDEPEAKAFAIADNRTAEFATWDLRRLSQLLQELQSEDLVEGIDELIASAATHSPIVIDDAGDETPPKNPVSRPGDLWILGNHRILCGDSTKPDDMKRLVGGRKPALVATDPPYCVDYTGADRPNDSGKDWSDNYREVEIKDLGEFLRATFKLVFRKLHCSPRISISAKQKGHQVEPGGLHDLAPRLRLSSNGSPFRNGVSFGLDKLLGARVGGVKPADHFPYGCPRPVVASAIWKTYRDCSPDRP